MTTKKTLWAAALAALAALAPACGGPLSIHFRGVMPINENDRKESNYVTARIYYLKDDARFNQATVDKLWTDAPGALGDDLVGSKEAKVQPGKADDPYMSVELGQLPDAVRFIGILGMYKKEDDKGPRKLALPKDEAGTVIRFTGYHVEKEK
jgi:type VI secretion system VasD/TssJ family lipoprotein